MIFILFVKKYRDNRLNMMLLMLICLWYMLPIFQVKTGKILLFVVLFGWLVTSKPRILIRALVNNILFFIWLFYMIVLYVFGGWEYGFLTPLTFFVDIPLFFCGAILFSYYLYNENYMVLAKVAKLSILSILIGSINSIIMLTIFPTASRELATGSIDSKIYAEMGIGGYGYVYASVMMIVALIYIFKNKQRLSNKFLFICTLALIGNLIFIIKASYTIAIIFLLILAVASLVNIKKVEYLYVFVFFSLISLVLLRSFVGELLISLAYLLPISPIVTGKILDLANGLIGNSFGPESTNRLNLYIQSFHAFKEAPIFGTTLKYSYTNGIGNHSAWLDLLGAFGIIGSLPIFYIFLSKIRRMRKMWINTKYEVQVTLIAFYVLIYGLINAIIFSYEFGFMFFFVIPSIPFSLGLLPDIRTNKTINQCNSLKFK